MASITTGVAAGPGVAVRRRRYMDRKSLVPLLLFLPPSLILFTVFVVLPMVDAGTFSFFQWNGYGPITNFVGLENYADVISHRNDALCRFPVTAIGIEYGGDAALFCTFDHAR